MRVEAYLERIGYSGSRALTAETLHGLQLAHLLTVPFENLSIHAGEPIVLEEEPLFKKVVDRRRGGFCYELNGLFAGLLRALGFEVEMLSARVARAGGGYTPEFDHMTLVVTLERPWLVDVGFGDTFRHPLRLDERAEQLQPGGAYLLRVEGDSVELRERKPGGDWKPQLRFTPKPHDLGAFQLRCDWHRTSRQSHFRRGRVCSRATPTGRVTLSEMQLIETTLEGERSESTLSDETSRRRVLSETFGVVR